MLLSAAAGRIALEIWAGALLATASAKLILHFGATIAGAMYLLFNIAQWRSNSRPARRHGLHLLVSGLALVAIFYFPDRPAIQPGDCADLDWPFKGINELLVHVADDLEPLISTDGQIARLWEDLKSDMDAKNRDALSLDRAYMSVLYTDVPAWIQSSRSSAIGSTVKAAKQQSAIIEKLLLIKSLSATCLSLKAEIARKRSNHYLLALLGTLHVEVQSYLEDPTRNTSSAVLDRISVATFPDLESRISMAVKHLHSLNTTEAWLHDECMHELCETMLRDFDAAASCGSGPRGAISMGRAVDRWPVRHGCDELHGGIWKPDIL